MISSCATCGEPVRPFLSEVTDPQTRELFSVLRCDGCGLGHTSPQPSDLGRYYGPSYHGGRHGFTALTRHTSSPDPSVIRASIRCSAGPVTSGTVTRDSAVSVPRAFLKYSAESRVTMPRTPGGSAMCIAKPKSVTHTVPQVLAEYGDKPLADRVALLAPRY